MRHRHKGKTLDRKKQPRELMLRNLAASIVLYEKVTTTKAKSQAVRPLVESLIHEGKKGTLQARRSLLSVLPQKNAVEKILVELAPRYKDRIGGYTRTIRMHKRLGDAAELVRIELV